MAKTATVEVWVMVDADGATEAGVESDTCEERFEEYVGGTGPRRMVNLRLRIALPEPVEVDVEVPDNAGEVTVTTE